MLEVIVFVCGAVVMILEMVGSRVLAPYLGTSIVVWTSLIGIILGALSVGYWWGGKLADKRPTHKVLSLIILLAAFFISGIALSKSFILSFLQQYTDHVHVGSIVSTLLLFAPPSVLLGMVSPYAVRLKMKHVQESGKTVGNLYAISTMGSIFGTFLAGFVLIAFLGSTTILFVLSLTLGGASIAAFLGDKLLKAAAMALFALLLVCGNAYESYLASLDFHDIDTDYNRIFIYKSIDAKTSRPMWVMVTNPKATQSAMYLDDHLELALSYTKYYELARHFVPGMKGVLMLGGGGYSFPKYALHKFAQMCMDVVELDPQVTSLARRFFALGDDARLRIFHEDARTFLNRSREKYDVILSDTFNSHYSIPFHLTTLETVKRLHDLLTEGGVVLVNILSSIEGKRGRFLRAEYWTFKAVFPQVYLFPVAAPEDGARWQNVMLVALKSPSNPGDDTIDDDIAQMLAHRWTKSIPADVPILTDDYSPLDRYIMAWP